MDIIKLKRKLKSHLGPALYKHSIAVERTARDLSRLHHVDGEKCAIAALLHDFSKPFGPEKMLKYVRKNGIRADKAMLACPKLLHGKIASHIARIEFGISDRQILLAIENHTFGRPRMNFIEKIVYLSDHIEPSRKYNGVSLIRRMARKDLNRAIAICAQEMIKYIQSRGYDLHQKTVRTRNYYLANGSGK